MTSTGSLQTFIDCPVETCVKRVYIDIACVIWQPTHVSQMGQQKSLDLRSSAQSTQSAACMQGFNLQPELSRVGGKQGSILWKQGWNQIGFDNMECRIRMTALTPLSVHAYRHPNTPLSRSMQIMQSFPEAPPPLDGVSIPANGSKASARKFPLPRHEPPSSRLLPPP